MSDDDLDVDRSVTAQKDARTSFIESKYGLLRPVHNRFLRGNNMLPMQNVMHVCPFQVLVCVIMNEPVHYEIGMFF